MQEEVSFLSFFFFSHSNRCIISPGANVTCQTNDFSVKVDK